MEDKFILDACCGPKFMWFNKNHPNVLYVDKRKEEKGFIKGRKEGIQPDIVADFRDLPFKDKRFKLVVWDVPHIKRKELLGNITKLYGALHPETWQSDLQKGFKECWRVLDDYGVLLFKFNDSNIKFKEVIKLFPVEPLFGQKTGHQTSTTKWFCFMKIPEFAKTKNSEQEKGK